MTEAEAKTQGNSGTAPTCFIIMPITVPPPMVEIYPDGASHFKNVCEHLFVPAVEAAGYTAVLPEAKGSEMIHDRIFTHLICADMVLCDMSCLNPNVFFEFGVRTALNKPIAIIRDDATPSIPFDTAIINYITYTASLYVYDIEDERTALRTHIEQTAEKSAEKNAMWQLLGYKTAAEPPSAAGSTTEAILSKLSLLSNQIANLAQKPRESRAPSFSFVQDAYMRVVESIAEEAKECLLPYGVRVLGAGYVNESCELQLAGKQQVPDDILPKIVAHLQAKFRVPIKVIWKQVP